MSFCPLCDAPATIVVVSGESSRVDCRVCTVFTITERALNYIKEHPRKVEAGILLVARAARCAQTPLAITDENHLAELMEEQRAREDAELPSGGCALWT